MTHSFTATDRVLITEQERQDALYSHIVVRSDLPLEAQMAQCAHAAQEAMRLAPDADRPIHIVILAAKDEADLIQGARALERSGLSFHLFHETHWPRGHTALGCAPQPKTAALKRALSRFKLWRAPEPAPTPAPAPAPAPDIMIEPTADRLNAKLTVSEPKRREAKLLFALTRLYEELSEAAFDAREGPSQARGLQLAKARLDRLSDEIELMEEEGQNFDEQSFEYWSAFADRRRFESFWSELSQRHCGDCTSTACSCARCHMEGFLGVDTSPRAERQRLMAENDKASHAPAPRATSSA